MKKILTIASLFVSTIVVAQTMEEVRAKAKPVSTPITAPPVASSPKSSATIESKMINPNAGEFKFVSESHDFGNIAEGPQAMYDFEFTNTGKEPILISNVHASCGCTTPVWPKEPILPAAKSKISVVYNTKGRPGPFTKTITISSNSKTPERQLIIKGSVDKAPENTVPAKTPAILNETPAGR